MAGAVITFLDITPIVRAEEALRDSEERFRSIVTQAAVGIARADVQGTFTYVNDRYCEIVGRKRETLVGKLRLQDLVHPDDQDRDLPLLERLFAEEMPLAIETRCRRPDGAIVWIRSNANPLYDGFGKLAGATAIAVEVTAEHEAVEQVRASSERNAALVAELQRRTRRNLLSLVRSMARRILGTSPSADDFHARLDERLGALSRVQGLLSRAEAPAVDLRDLILLELSAVGAEGEEQRVRLEGPPVGLPFLTVQTMPLAIHELATNARKHGALAAPEGRLMVAWKLEQADGAAPTLVLEWQEEGVPPQEDNDLGHSGYGRELIERALPYQRVQPPGWNWMAGGCGAGLPCLFTIPWSPTMTSGPSHDLHGRVILVVEDEFFIADDLTATLEGHGARVVGPVGNLPEAMALLETCGRLDGAVLDVNLNGELSFPLAGSLEQRGVPFLFTTGYDEQGIPPDLRHVPRLEKPVSLIRLAALLSAITSSETDKRDMVAAAREV